MPPEEEDYQWRMAQVHELLERVDGAMYALAEHMEWFSSTVPVRVHEVSGEVLAVPWDDYSRVFSAAEESTNDLSVLVNEELSDWGTLRNSLTWQALLALDSVEQAAQAFINDSAVPSPPPSPAADSPGFQARYFNGLPVRQPESPSFGDRMLEDLVLSGNAVSGVQRVDREDGYSVSWEEDDPIPGPAAADPPRPGSPELNAVVAAGADMIRWHLGRPSRTRLVFPVTEPTPAAIPHVTTPARRAILMEQDDDATGPGTDGTPHGSTE